MAKKGKAQSGKIVKEGLCALTEIVGPFVKSHLIPQALTLPDFPGSPFMEVGRGSRPIRRFTSWFDDALVIRAGEDYLSDIDSRAIAELRKQKLVWSGWGKNKVLVCNHHEFISVEGCEGLRMIPGVDTEILRLFLLSLLWRALVTTRKEFSHVTNVGVDIEELRKIILSGEPGDPFRYPIMLYQMSTRGVVHNNTPSHDEVVLPAIDDESEDRIDTYRFYMQGMVAHIYAVVDRRVVRRLGNMPLGCSENTLIFTWPFDSSKQLRRIESVFGGGVNEG